MLANGQASRERVGARKSPGCPTGGAIVWRLRAGRAGHARRGRELGGKLRRSLRRASIAYLGYGDAVVDVFFGTVGG